MHKLTRDKRIALDRLGALDALRRRDERIGQLMDENNSRSLRLQGDRIAIAEEIQRLRGE